MTTTISGTNGIDKVAVGAVTTNKLPSGTVLQVVQGTLTTQISSTSTTFVTSGLTASITPSSASNKIMVMVNGGKTYAPSVALYCALYRNGSSIGSQAAVYTPVSDATAGANQSFCYLDSPATTSSVTYTLYFKSSNGSLVYFSDGPGTAGQVNITLMEIAA